MQNGHAPPPQQPVNINPMQAAVYALQFMENVPHSRAQREAYDIAVAMLQAIAAGQVVLAPPTPPPQVGVPQPRTEDES